MKRHALYTFALAGLLVAGSATAQPPRARAGQPAPRAKVQHKIVMVDENGKERVIEGEGFRVRRGYLGIGLTELTPELRQHFGAPEDAGVMISRIEPDSPAAKAGLEVGDILISLDGKEVASSWDIRAQARDFKEGEQVPLQIYRGGKMQTLSATVAMRERPELDMAPFLFQRGGDGEREPMVFQMPRMEGRELRRGEGAPGPRLLHSPREAELEKRLKELEKRLADLEKQLEKK